MQQLLTANPDNRTVVFPFIGGDEVNTSPTHEHQRYVIDFFDRPLGMRDHLRPWSTMTDGERRACLAEGLVPSDYADSVAEDWPELLEIVRQRVKPERDGQKRKAVRVRWWQFADKRPGLYHKAARLSHVLVANAGASPHLGIGRLATGTVYSHALVVLAYPNLSPFAVLQSRIHEIWARFFSSSMKDDLRYAPSDCFETFPFPPGYETDVVLEAIGQTYHDHRATLMVAADEGMTKTYNRFHKESETGAAIQRLRDLHDEMDRAVLRAYGWDDLAETLQPEFLTEETEDDHTYQGRYFWPAAQRDLVLSRLLALNADRYAEEVRQGLHEKGKKRVRDEDDSGEEDAPWMEK